MAQNSGLLPEPGCITRAQLILRGSNEMFGSGETAKIQISLTLLYLHKDCGSNKRWCKAQWQTPLVSPQSYTTKPDRHLVWGSGSTQWVSGEAESSGQLVWTQLWLQAHLKGAPTQPELNLLFKQPVTHQQLQRHSLALSLDVIRAETGVIDFQK